MLRNFASLDYTSSLYRNIRREIEKMAEYTTREMVEAIELAPPVRNFLTRTFSRVNVHMWQRKLRLMLRRVSV